MRTEHVADVAKSFEQCFNGSGADASQVGFELGEGQMGGMEIATIGGQEFEGLLSVRWTGFPENSRVPIDVHLRLCLVAAIDMKAVKRVSV